MLQNRLLAGAIVLLTLLTACNSKKGESNIPNTTNEATADTIAAEQVADSTIYGTSGEDFGMSTFCLITTRETHCKYVAQLTTERTLTSMEALNMATAMP